MNSINERGAMLLVSGDGDMQAWLPLGAANEWREISWVKDNEPILQVRHVVIQPKALAKFIQENYLGWIVRKLNLSGICVDEEGIIIPPDN